MDYLKQAEQFLTANNIGFVCSGMIGRDEETKIEVIFPVPGILGPTVAVVDPPDVRVWVHKITGAVELIQQM